MAARETVEMEKGVVLNSGGGHRVDDCVIHHDTSNGGEDVTADQTTIFIETITPVGPLFDTRSIAERFVLQRLIQFVIVLNFSVEADPDPFV